MVPQATNSRKMGSFRTSHAMATALRGREEGSSFGPSLRKRSAASFADNPVDSERTVSSVDATESLASTLTLVTGDGAGMASPISLSKSPIC